MSDELNSQSSQPSTDASVGQGPNGAGQPSEPVVTPGLTESQNRDYTTKTQQLAQERRELEQERAELAEQRARYQPQGQAQNGYFQNPIQPDQGYGAAVQPNQSLIPIDPQEYANLVEQFGKDGAEAQVRFIQKATAPAQKLIALALQKAHENDVKSVTQDLNARGAQTYGEEWKTHGPAVIDLIGKTGILLKQAWYAINGESIEQAARDKAYQTQETKEAGNVGQSNVQPASTHAGKFNDFDSAFESAWAQGQR